jgi:anti-anti-sigma factor
MYRQARHLVGIAAKSYIASEPSAAKAPLYRHLLELRMYSDRAFDTRREPQPPLPLDLRCSSDTDPPRMVIFGELDELTADRLQKAVLKVLRLQRPDCIEMDFHGVTFLDSAGIRTLVTCQMDAQQMGCQIKLIRTSPLVYRVLQITGLVDFLGVAAVQPPDGRV